jgi:hypothetical protein
MANYWVDEEFIKRFEELQRMVGVSNTSAGSSKYNHFSDVNRESIQVKINSVVESPVTGDYIDGSTIQFTARQVAQDEENGGFSNGVLNFDSTITSGIDTVDQFDVENLYGIGIDFDFAKPLDSEDDFKDKVFDATKKLINVKDSSGEFEAREVWSITPASEASTNISLCTITSELGGSDYAVDVRLGNLIGPIEGELKKGILHLTYSTTDPVTVGASIMAIIHKNTTDESIDYDCFPIETMMNLVALPEEEE